MSREETKAAAYIHQLNEARCHGNWSAVPELLRKIRKYSQHRTCLITAAECEYTLAMEAHNNITTINPPLPIVLNTTTTSISSTSLGITKFIPVLEESISKDKTHNEDWFQAQVCLGWIYWQLGEFSSAIAKLPSNIVQEYAELDSSENKVSEWTKLCAIKASYIKGNSLQKNNLVSEALDTLESALPILLSLLESIKYKNEILLWVELFLTSLCMLCSEVFKTRTSATLKTDALSAFRLWAKFWDVQDSVPASIQNKCTESSRRCVWREYYITLSHLIRHDLPYPTTALLVAYPEVSTRYQQRAELKKVESQYEKILISEAPFPTAESNDEEVEAFVEVVMQNWRIICGYGWKETDLGDGGAVAVSRGVLEILYRASKKTFHSTTILRYLFAVHLTIAEFDLAFKAFETFMDKVTKGRSRQRGPVENDDDIFGDEVFIRTACEYIKAICRYGYFEEANYANKTCKYLEDWLNAHFSNNFNAEDKSSHDELSLPPKSNVLPQTIALAWRCVGIGYAQHAKLTFDATSRSDIQSKAEKYLRRSLLPQYESTREPETIFALGLLLAEQRQLSDAIEVVKCGLLPISSDTHSIENLNHTRRSQREIMLIPLWNLMSLLLSARQKFSMASKSCAGAFEQFQHPVKSSSGNTDSIEGSLYQYKFDVQAKKTKGVIEVMNEFEKENLLDVKMTQLALIEVLEGPEVAVNACDELLSLFAKLFGDIKENRTPVDQLPAMSNQSIGPIKGSLFGCSARRVNTNTDSLMARPASPKTKITKTPKIQVTGEDIPAAAQKSTGGNEPSQRTDSQVNSIKFLKNNINESHRNEETNFTTSQYQEDKTQVRMAEDQESKTMIESVKDQISDNFTGKECHPQGQMFGAINPESSGKDYLAMQSKVVTEDPKIRHHIQENQGVRSLDHSWLNPAVRFSKDQQRRRKLAILIKVWLMISGLYRRASFYEDAHGAINEAHQLMSEIDTSIVKEMRGSQSVLGAGLSLRKSTGEVWGDIYAELGYITIAEKSHHSALMHFETALTHFRDHPSAIVGLSGILIDIYTQELLPPPSIPTITPPDNIFPSSSTSNVTVRQSLKSSLISQRSSTIQIAPARPLGFPVTIKSSITAERQPKHVDLGSGTCVSREFSHKDPSTFFLDRLAARDRAFGLLRTLTNTGVSWNCSEAWFALARAYEESGQLEKTREALWRCVELEESKGVRSWGVAGSGGYVL
ncbi:/filamentation protein [Blumeria hordei DH14]|uniref:/filamentation protein n=1 Tax=Blumeria graminis f. sp. hordei (strain DH14) TaxID=546991 RepID=N1JG14_BLUG1|nr:/filamentation protein [Blumeria hordei DH14]